jgi:hypothetical protein
LQSPQLDLELTVQREIVLHPYSAPTVKLAFPLSNAFLQDLSMKALNRLIKLGWDLPKITHLGMPYFGAFPPAYEPTYSMLGLIIIPEKKVFFRCIAWNTAFLKIAHDISVEESIYHEKLHLSKDEPTFRKAIPFHWEHKLELGRDIKNESVSYVINKYGKRAEDILDADATKRYRRQAEEKTILGDVLSFWLRRYFQKNFLKYRNHSIALTSKLSSAKVFKNVEISDSTIKKMYKEHFGYRIR